jgi:hypothetical protein
MPFYENEKFGVIVTNENYIHGGVKIRLNLVNISQIRIYYLPFSFLKTWMVKISKTVILAVVLYGCLIILRE